MRWYRLCHYNTSMLYWVIMCIIIYDTDTMLYWVMYVIQTLYMLYWVMCMSRHAFRDAKVHTFGMEV